MVALKTSLLASLLLVVTARIGCTQTSRSLQDRVHKADPKTYHSIQDAKSWKNPYLIVRRNGIEIVGMPPVGRAITVESVPAVLERLPDSAWPYGLVVAVQDIG